jgi:PDZ domain
LKRLACVVLALAAFGWLLFATLWYFRLPFYGFEVLHFPENRALPLAEGALVRAGDRVKEVNDKPLENPGDLAAILRAAAGSPVKLEVERGGERLELVQRPLPHSPRVWLRHAANSLAGLVLLGVGLLVVLRPTGTPGRLFFLFCVAVALLLAGLPEGFGSEVFQQVAGHAILAALLFSGAFLLHFFLLFPHPHRSCARSTETATSWSSR